MHAPPRGIPLDVDDVALEVAAELLLDELAIVPSPVTPLDGALDPPAPPAPPEELKTSPQPLAMETAIAADTSAAAILERVLWFMVRLGSFASTGSDATRSFRARGGKVSARRAPATFIVGVLGR